MPKRKKIEYKGRVFASITELSKHLNLSPTLLSNRIRAGIAVDAPKKHSTKNKPVVFNGQHFPSTRALARHLGISTKTLEYNQKKGLPICRKPIKPTKIEIFIDGTRYDTIKEASRQLGIPRNRLALRIRELGRTNFSIKELSSRRRTKTVKVLDKQFNSIAEFCKFLGVAKSPAKYKNPEKFRRIVRHGKKYEIGYKNRPTTFESIFRIIDNIDRNEWCYDFFDIKFKEKLKQTKTADGCLRLYRHPVLKNLIHKNFFHRKALYHDTNPLSDTTGFFTICQFLSERRELLKKWHTNIDVFWTVYSFRIAFEYKLSPFEKIKEWARTREKVYPMEILDDCFDEMMSISYTDFRKKTTEITASITTQSLMYERLAEGKSYSELNNP